MKSLNTWNVISGNGSHSALADTIGKNPNRIITNNSGGNPL
jgi:hypothetical protein